MLFFDGKLAHLHGQSAAALAFLINRIAKLVDNMTPLVRQDFLFDKEKMDALIEQAREAEKADLPERIERLEREKSEIERFILSGDHVNWPTGEEVFRQKRDNEIKLKKYSTPEILKEEKEFFVTFEALTKQVKQHFDKYVPNNFSGKELLRKVLNCVDETVLSPRWGREFKLEETTRFSRIIASDLIIRNPVIWTIKDWKLDIVVTMTALQKLETDIAALPDNKRMALQQVSVWLNMLLHGYSSDLIAKIEADRADPEILDQYEVRIRQLCDELPKLAKQRDDAVLALQDVKDGMFTGYNAYGKASGNVSFIRALNDYQESRRDIYGEMQPHQFTADLYFMKAYLVAADMYNQQGEERTATADVKAGKDIFTYRFSDTGKEEKGFADVHFKVTQAPLAEAMVKAQMRGEK